MRSIPLLLANANEMRDRGDVFRGVLNENKELITRPAITLVPSIFSLFTLPLFIIGLSLRCQNLENHPLRYLQIAFYSITFIPQMITFPLYIYPSSFFWKQWQSTTISKRISAFRQHSSTTKDSTIASMIKEHRTRYFS
jgi:hypothetical protein